MKQQKGHHIYFLDLTSFAPTEAGLQVIDGPRLQGVLQLRQASITVHVEICR